MQFTWGESGRSALYDFTTDYTENPETGVQKLDLTTANCYVCNGTDDTWASAGGDLLTAGKKIYFDATLSAYSYEGEGLQQSAMGDGETMYCFLTGSDGVKSLTMTQETDPTAADRKLWSCTIPAGTYTAVQFSATDNQDAPQETTRPESTARQKSPQPCKNPASLPTTAIRRPTRAAKVSTVTATGARKPLSAMPKAAKIPPLWILQAASSSKCQAQSTSQAPVRLLHRLRAERPEPRHVPGQYHKFPARVRHF